jgi:hypothetical protein
MIQIQGPTCPGHKQKLVNQNHIPISLSKKKHLLDLDQRSSMLLGTEQHA